MNLKSFLYIYGVIPHRFFTSDFDPYLLGLSELPPPYLTLFTSMFLHGGWVHFISNMLFLWIFGDNVEDRMGHLRYLIFYLSCGVIAGVAHIYTNSESLLPTIGASGAIAGVLGAYFRLFPYSRIVTLIPYFLFWQIIEIPAVLFLGFWFLIQFLSGTLSLGLPISSGVAWWAHIGGFASGFLLVGIFIRNRA